MSNSVSKAGKSIRAKKQSISFSGLTKYDECSQAYYLTYIKKVFPFTDSVWTHFGTLVHKYLQATLLKKRVRGKASKPWREVWVEPMAEEEAAKKFIRTWFRFCSLYRKQLALFDPKLDAKSLYKNPVKAIMGLDALLTAEFGKYETLAIEQELKEEAPYDKLFKGFIDVVIKAEDGRVVIIDIKTISSLFFFNKYKDAKKDYQLTLYKDFYSRKYDLDQKFVETYFMTIDKPVSSKKPLNLVRVGSTPKKVSNAKEWLRKTLSLIDQGKFVKNFNHCLKYGEKYPCPFLNTSHCRTLNYEGG